MRQETKRSKRNLALRRSLRFLPHSCTKSRFKDGKIKIHWDRQEKHIPDTRNFIPGRSSITISKKRLEELLEKHAGTGQPVGKKAPGMADYRERIDFGEIIGEFIEEKDGVIKKALTTKGIIIYDGDGFIHVFPARP